MLLTLMNSVGPALWDASLAFVSAVFSMASWVCGLFMSVSGFLVSSIFIRFSARSSVPHISPFFMRLSAIISVISCLQVSFCQRGSGSGSFLVGVCVLFCVWLPMRIFTRFFHFFSHRFAQIARNVSNSLGSSL